MPKIPSSNLSVSYVLQNYIGINVNFYQVRSNEMSNSSLFGINRTSILEEVPEYSVVTGLPHGIMHDLFEGFVHYELKLFFGYCVRQQKYVTIKDLNQNFCV